MGSVTVQITNPVRLIRKAMMSLLKGWDVIYKPPGEVESQSCPTCGEEMSVKRGVTEATSYAESVMQKKSTRDIFTCHDANEKWHIQARILKSKIIHTPSASIERILKEEVEQILKTKKCTKEVSGFYDVWDI
jgi:hypothetical protein